ncbi:MAG TPA: NAD(P)H-quinone oxidoreductase [Gemmatimonadales bacterium]|nr:NAD(P)H-quinone oxidoreductase [Gemmatimonadales bacterium]
MRSLHATERDGRYTVQLVERDIPRPAAGEVLVRVAASGLNRADLSQVAGRYPPPPGESDILGLELSGHVAESGAAVCALVAGGAHAEYAAVPEGQLFPAPRSLDLVRAAGIPEAYLTAFVNLVGTAALERGQRVLIHAGASGVGLAAIALARFLGAAVAATTRSPEKVQALIQAGATLALQTPKDDVAAAVEHAWGTNAIDVVLDPVGGPGMEQNLRVLATGGRIVVIATMGGARPEIDLSLLMRKRAAVIGSTLRARSRAEKARLVSRFRAEVLPGFDDGRLGVVVDTVYPPARAGEALQRMRENQSVGKLLIAWP